MVMHALALCNAFLDFIACHAWSCADVYTRNLQDTTVVLMFFLPTVQPLASYQSPVIKYFLE